MRSRRRKSSLALRALKPDIHIVESRYCGPVHDQADGTPSSSRRADLGILDWSARRYVTVSDRNPRGDIVLMLESLEAVGRGRRGAVVARPPRLQPVDLARPCCPLLRQHRLDNAELGMRHALTVAGRYLGVRPPSGLPARELITALAHRRRARQPDRRCEHHARELMSPSAQPRSS